MASGCILITLTTPILYNTFSYLIMKFSDAQLRRLELFLYILHCTLGRLQEDKIWMNSFIPFNELKLASDRWDFC